MPRLPRRRRGKTPRAGPDKARSRHRRRTFAPVRYALRHVVRQAGNDDASEAGHAVSWQSESDLSIKCTVTVIPPTTLLAILVYKSDMCVSYRESISMVAYAQMA